MSLREIFCQERAVSILQRARAAERSAHAYIFAGAEGVGKFKTARQWGRLLLCKDVRSQNNGEKFADSCGLCESCKLFDNDSHPDFQHVYKELVRFTRDGKNKTTPVNLPKDVVKEFLVEKVSSMPAFSDRRVFVVSESEKLNAASQNSLLKVLEEPPEYCCIILLCTRLERLLPTIKSRCQIIRFGPIDEEKIIDKLKETGLDGARSQYFGRLSQGSIGQACDLAALELGDADLYQAKKELVRSVANYKYADSIRLAESFLKESKKVAAIWSKMDESVSKSDIDRRVEKIFVRIVISALQDAMKLDLDGGEKNINFDQLDDIRTLSRRMSPEQSAEKIVDCYEITRWIDSSVNEKLIFEQLLLNLDVCDII